MIDETALLAEMIARPDDDAPRLVWADLLTARGDPLGELISLQCRLAAAPDDAARRRLRIAENKLLAAHGEAWTAKVKAVLPEDVWDVPTKASLVRGFVEHVSTWVGVLDRLDELFAAAPLLRSLELAGPAVVGDDPPGGRALASLAGLTHPRLAQLHTFELQLFGAGNAAARAVAAAALTGLRALTLQVSILEEAGGLLDADGVSALAEAPALRGLQSLDLSFNELGAAAVDALAAATFSLRHLDLSGHAFDAAAATRLAAAPAFSGLVSLRLRAANLGVEGAVALARSPVLTTLEALDLSETHLGPEAAAAFFEALSLPRLRALRLERARIGDRGLAALLACAALPRLTDLELGHNAITKEGARALAESPRLGHLERLLLNEGRWRPPTVELLTTSKTLARCKLYLRGRLVPRRT